MGGGASFFQIYIKVGSSKSMYVASLPYAQVQSEIRKRLFVSFTFVLGLFLKGHNLS